MKNTFLILTAFLCILTSCKEDATKKIDEANLATATQRDVAASEFPIIEFNTREHDFGEISQGTNMETVFTYKNVGDAPLVITDIKSTCGCTVPQDWSREPLAVGESGKFTVKFDGSGQNKVTKSITVVSNTKTGQDVVRITAFVGPKRSLEVN